MAGTGTFGAVITHGDNHPDKTTVGFTVAGAAAGSNRETAAFRYNDAVNIAVGGDAEESHEDGPAPLGQLLSDFRTVGGQLRACGMGVGERGLDSTRIIDSGTMFEFLADGTPAVAY